MKKVVNKKKKNRDLPFICGMLALPILHFCIFYIFVYFNSILLAFQTQVGTEIEWGFENFAMMFRDIGSSGSVLISALKNTMIFFFSGLLITLPLSFVMCYFLYKKIPGYRLYRIIFYLPCIIMGSVTAILFKYIISSNGPISLFFQGEVPHFLHSSEWAMPTLVFYTIFFGLGGNLVLFSGAMNNIDPGVIEAGKIDGTNLWTEMRYIVLPTVWPTVSTVLIFNFIGIFNASGPILLFTQGAYDTYTLSYWIYSRVLYTSDLNYPSAVGLFLTIIGAPIAITMYKLMNRNADDVTM